MIQQALCLKHTEALSRRWDLNHDRCCQSKTSYTANRPSRPPPKMFYRVITGDCKHCHFKYLNKLQMLSCSGKDILNSPYSLASTLHSAIPGWLFLLYTLQSIVPLLYLRVFFYSIGPETENQCGYQ